MKRAVALAVEADIRACGSDDDVIPETDIISLSKHESAQARKNILIGHSLGGVTLSNVELAEQARTTLLSYDEWLEFYYLCRHRRITAYKLVAEADRYLEQMKEEESWTRHLFDRELSEVDCLV